MDKLIYIKWMVKHAPIAAATPTDVIESPCDDCPEGYTATWVCDKRIACIPWLNYHDAAIRREAYEQGAREERERVLDEVYLVLDNARGSAETHADMEVITSVSLGWQAREQQCKDLMIQIESLRSGKEK